MKKILFAASESVPFIKTGGLADVVGSLPKYFDKEKYDVRVMLPKYMCMKDEWKEKLQYHTHFYMDLNWRKQYVGVLEMEYDGIKFYFIDNEYYFNGYSKKINKMIKERYSVEYVDRMGISTMIKMLKDVGIAQVF